VSVFATRGRLACIVVLLAAAATLAALGYRTRDPDSVLYARIAARMSHEPAERWIAPDWPPRGYAHGPYREHPVGVFVLPALLARLGYSAEQAAYVLNAVYQVGVLLLVPSLASAFADERLTWRLSSLLQLVPIAFTYRIRANQEAAVLLCLVVALVGTERSRERPAFVLVTVAGLVALALVKGLVVIPAFLACGAWLVASSIAKRRTTFGWLGLALAAVATVATAAAYEMAYVRATGSSFLEYYLGRATRADPNPAAAVSDALYNLVWYGARVLWFAAPWSVLALLAWRGRGGLATLSARARGGIFFTIAATVVYTILFSLGERRAERYIFPVYFIVASGGALVAMQRWPKIERALRRLDAALAPAVVFALTFALHLLGGALELPRIKVWAPDV
jgi:4-amino-4-deoxy-L-arabinose transferase-like glycosyltransferase